MRKFAIAAAITPFLALAPAAGAFAAPDPSHGPIEGGTTVTIPTPKEITFESLALGGSTTFGIASDGNTYAWGDNRRNQFGNGTDESSYYPTLVNRPESGVAFTDIAATTFNAAAIGTDGKAYGWGYNAYGAVGDGTTTDRTSPVPVASDGTFNTIDAGFGAFFVSGPDKKTYAWGNGNYYQLGDGLGTDQFRPVAVSMPTDGTEFESVSAGVYISLAIGSNGKTYSWGLKSSGALGTGATSTHPVPAQIHLPDDGTLFTSVYAGGTGSFAIGTNGKTYSWGNHLQGDAADESSLYRNKAAEIIPPAGDVQFTSIAPGWAHIVAMGADGNVYAWGYNQSGALGDGSEVYFRAIPEMIASPANGASYTKIYSDQDYSLALGSDGNAYAWGIISMASSAMAPR